MILNGAHVQVTLADRALNEERLLEDRAARRSAWLKLMGRECGGDERSHPSASSQVAQSAHRYKNPAAPLFNFCTLMTNNRFELVCQHQFHLAANCRFFTLWMLLGIHTTKVADKMLWQSASWFLGLDKCAEGMWEMTATVAPSWMERHLL